MSFGTKDLKFVWVTDVGKTHESLLESVLETFQFTFAHTFSAASTYPVFHAS